MHRRLEDRSENPDPAEPSGLLYLLVFLPEHAQPRLALMYFNTTVSNASPLLLYVPLALWNEGNASDPELVNYANQSYHSTTSSASGNPSVSFAWHGTGIWLYGSYRSRLGPYRIVLDGKLDSYPGFQEGQEEGYQYLLFGAHNLTDGPHEVQLANIGSETKQSILDIDYLVFETYLSGSDEAWLASTNLNATSFDYSPSQSINDSAWNIDSKSIWTNDPLGVARIPFTGQVISIFGHLSNTSSPSFTATLDSSQTRQLTNNVFTNAGVGNESSQLIFFASGLSADEEHELVLRNNPGRTGERSVLNIAYAVNGTVASSNVVVSTKSKSKKIEVVIATSVAGLTFMGVYFLLWPLYQKWRRERSMHALFDYSLAPRPYPILFFAMGRHSREHARRRQSHGVMGRDGDAMESGIIDQHRLRSSMLREVGEAPVPDRGGKASRPPWNMHEDHRRNGDSSNSPPEPPMVPPNTMRIPRPGPERISFSNFGLTPWRYSTLLDWPGDAPPRYREVL